MADMIEKKEIQYTQLPPIANKEQQNNVKEQSSAKQLQNGASILPQTHKRKHKKPHKKPRKHSPQYYEQKRLKKLNKMRERNWDSHFMNDQIPDLLNKKKIKQKRALTRAIQDRRSLTANEHKLIVKTGATTIQNKGTQVLDGDKKNKTAKSFKIRVVNKKHDELAQDQKANYKTQQVRQFQKKPVAKTQKSRPKRGSHIDENLKQLKQQYKKKIQSTSQQHKITNCHKQLLEQFLALIYNKGIRQMLDKQLTNLINKKSQINKIMQSIEKRESLLKKLSETKLIQKVTETDKLKQQQKSFFQQIDNYRTSTLVCIQQILKWKQYWQQTYSDVFNSSKTFDFVWKDQNYLLTIMKSTNEILAEYNKKYIKKENEVNKDEQVKQNINESQKTRSKDPFLISIYDISNEDKNIILKIRACQLLLLEQQYASIKN